MSIKSFRGKMADASQDIIALHTNNGSTGYKIKKLRVIPEDPTDDNAECVLKIYSIKQTTIDDTINFSDNTLLAVAFWKNSATVNYSADTHIIFDNMIINQDIYLTYDGDSSTVDLNYYIELEQVKLDLSENTVATLKDIKNIEQRSQI